KRLIVDLARAKHEVCTKARAKELGVYDFLDKPFNIKQLVRRVSNAMAEKSRAEVDRSSS
ncbi:MAG: hypothetical protein QME81_12730, partial [bacterium]|nr:hypothetical protein [bacterium]